MTVVEVRGASYDIHEKLKAKWDKLKDGYLAQRDEDRVFIVDGRERSGKSLFTIQQAAYIDPSILDDEGDKKIPRICFSSEELLHAVRHTKSTKDHTKVVIYDEAFRGLSSRGALSKTNKAIMTALQEMGQNNIILFIVSPSFFLLELYAAVLRSSALFHIKKDKRTKRRFWTCYNEKKKGLLYRNGVRKGWNYNVYSGFRCNFSNIYPGGEEFEARYRLKKAESLRNPDKTITGEDEKPKKEIISWKGVNVEAEMWKRGRIIGNLYKFMKKCEKNGVKITHAGILEFLIKIYGDKWRITQGNYKDMVLSYGCDEAEL